MLISFIELTLHIARVVWNKELSNETGNKLKMKYEMMTMQFVT